MANMSYCRFHNTAFDFKDCLETLNEAESFRKLNLSEDENRAMNRLAGYARQFLERYTELQELEEYDYVRYAGE